MALIDVESVLSKLTQKDKIDLLSGVDFWHTKGFPQHNVPSLRLSDGPNGVRGQRNFCGTPGAAGPRFVPLRQSCANDTTQVFPCGTGLGATWDQDLLFKAGVLMSDESRAKGVHILLGPCINMQRSPLGGRGFESISEDPMLAGLSAAALTKGIQRDGVAACIKHFVCNDQEHERNAYDAQVTQRALREIYLLPFQIAIRDSRPECLMTSYNKINGTHASENKELLQTVLRDEWAWKGVVVSDWFGTYSTSDAINAGLDLEMPGPTRFRGNALGHDVTCNKISRSTIDARARSMLELVCRCAPSGIKENAVERELNTPQTSALLRKIAGDCIVLMKNDNDLLPLSKTKSVVVIGPNSKVSTYCGGGSSSLEPYYAITPYDAISAKLDYKDIKYTVGTYSHKELPLLGRQLTGLNGQPGVTFSSYLEGPDIQGRRCVDTKTILNTNMFFMDYKVEGDTTGLWYADIEGFYVPEADGKFKFGICVYGTAKLFVDGNLVVDNATVQRQGSAFYGSGTIEEVGTVIMKAGQKYHVKIEFASAPTNKLATGGVVRFGGGGVRIGGAMEIDTEEEIKRAVALAISADQVIICAGLNGDWESEGSDRQNMDLPGHHDALITAVAKANPNTVVVMQSGSPVSMPWLSQVPALIQAWYGGNETGNAIADVIFGDVNPSGKLPLTFPLCVEDNPAFLNYRSERGRTLYGEDVYIGYRYYEASKKKVLFPFGHGLSYTTFQFSDAKVTVDKEISRLKVSVSIQNTGSVAGAEVAQVYISQRNPSIGRPVKELKGFTKVFLEVGEKQEVHIVVETKYAASFWDEGCGMWVMEKDMYDVLVGSSSALFRDAVIGSFEVENSTWWKGL